MSKKKTGIVGKIKYWMQPDGTSNLFCLQRNESGQYVYYPWGEGGEGYLISEREKNKFRKIERITSSLVLPFLVMFIIFDAVFDGSVSQYNWLFVVFMNIIMLGFVGYIYLFTRKLEVFTPSQKSVYQVSIYLKKLFVSAFLQLFLILLGLFWNPHSVPLMVTGLFIAIFYPILILFFWLRKGFVFQKKTPLQ